MIRARLIVKRTGLVVVALLSIGYFVTQVAQSDRTVPAAAVDAVSFCLFYLLVGYLLVLAPMDWIRRRRQKRQRVD